MLIDADVLEAWGNLQVEVPHEKLSPDQPQRTGRLAEVLEQFLAADKCVFVTPTWNFAFAHGEAHIDAIGIAGKTFRNTQEGEVIGLLSEKRADHIQARGGIYTEGERVPFEMGHRYLSTILAFLGIRKAEHVYLEGHAMFPERAPEIRDRGIEQARQLADSF